MERKDEDGKGHAPTADHAPPDALVSARKCITEKNLSQACSVLEQALEEQRTSEQLWICYLKLRSQMASPTQLPELYQLFSRAVTTSQSYSVLLEVRWWGWQDLCEW